MKKMFRNEVDETLGRLGRKLETKKLENSNKLKEYRIMKQEIKNEAKREKEELRIEKEIELEKIREIKAHVREMRITIMFYEG